MFFYKPGVTQGTHAEHGAATGGSSTAMAQRNMARHGELAWRYSGEWRLARTGEHRGLSRARTQAQAR